MGLQNGSPGARIQGIRKRGRGTSELAPPAAVDQKGVIQMKNSMRDVFGLTLGILAVMLVGALRVLEYMPHTI